MVDVFKKYKNDTDKDKPRKCSKFYPNSDQREMKSKVLINLNLMPNSKFQLLLNWMGITLFVFREDNVLLMA